VHECYLRLAKLSQLGSDDISFLLAYAARAMRSIIIDILRERDSQRHGGAAVHVTFDPESHAAPSNEADVLRVNDALEELQVLEPRLVSVVEMKYFAGLTFAEIAAALDLTERTVRRDWQKARLLLHNELKEP
jgi:RNA polymerase sigma factor (TIGR02999 family)